MKGASAPFIFPLELYTASLWHQAGRYPLFSCAETGYQREAEKGV